MLVNGKHFRTVWMQDSTVKLIEQNLLPFEFSIHDAKTHKDTAHAIKTMIVRGAGAIGATAGYGMAQAFLEARENDWNYIDAARRAIEITRPTAQNLFYATRRVYESAKKSSSWKEAIAIAQKEAQAIADEDAEACKAIGTYGAELLKDGCRMETHCNAGWLAFVDYGSALSPVYVAKGQGKKIFVYADETRPRSQGARLTAWELKNENIEHAIIPDNAAAHLMQHGEIDIVIVGADRIAANGDAANKIGTLEKAICAKEFGIPFCVAAPLSTFDLNCKGGKEIPIEERSEDEVLYQTGQNSNNTLEKILVCSPGSRARNPAFDVTPAKFIAGIITPKGIIRPDAENIKSLFK